MQMRSKTRYKLDPNLFYRESGSPAAEQAERLLFASRVFVVASFLGLLALVGILSFVLPKPTVSEYEKRTLATMPEFSVNELFWGSYLRDVEMFYADTFPFRDNFVQVGAWIGELKGVRVDGVRIIENAPRQEEVAPPSIFDNMDRDDEDETGAGLALDENSEAEEEYTPWSVEDDGAEGEYTTEGLFIYKNRAMEIFGGSQTMRAWYAETLNKYAQRFGSDVNVYNIVVPSAVEFALPDRYKSVSNPEKPAIDDIYAQLDSGITAVDAWSSIERHAGEYVYFNTDHHWTALGAYYAYTAFCESAGIEPLALEDYSKRTIEGGFLGTLYSRSYDTQLKSGIDTVEYYVVPGEFEAVRYDRGAPNSPISTPVWNEGVSGGNSYLVFLSGDHPLMEIKTSNKNGRKAVLIKESYGNAFAPFLVAHYEEIYVVDQRYFEKGLLSLVAEKDIDDVIFLNNVFAANTKYHIERIESMMY